MVEVGVGVEVEVAFAWQARAALRASLRLQD